MNPHQNDLDIDMLPEYDFSGSKGVRGKYHHEQGEMKMEKVFTLEYWIDDDWYVGKIKEIPGVFSQGETLDELEKNIQDAYQMIMESEPDKSHPNAKTKDLALAL